MNLLIQKSNNKTSNVVKLEMLSTEFSSTIKLIKENEIPVIVFTDTNESFLINNINDIINNAKVNTEVLLEITENDLISLGSGGSSEPVDSRPYKVYTALLTQSGTDAPVATVLENTLGDINWTRGAQGYYIATSGGLFTLDKTIFLIEPSSNSAENGFFETNDKTVNTVEITYSRNIGGTSDNILVKTGIEIRVYN